ncbi:MAG: flagellar basal-body rod protein FlgG, partial [Ramlibacter sp.]|nr:flagellar basal-body rod protein FlgG [Ramlibacter sp.]
MMRSLSIAKTGLEAQQTQLDTITHNLANVATNGYKRSRAVFEDLMYQNLRQSGAPSSAETNLPTGLQLGSGVRTVATSRNFSQGSIAQTGNQFDVAINGQGFFQVTMPDGSNAYSRDGSFQVDAQGQMVTSSGYLLNPAITVPANAQTVTVGRDGIVSVMLPNATAPQQIGQLQLANFINPAGLEPRGGNLYTETASSGSPQTGNPATNGLGTVTQGSL